MYQIKRLVLKINFLNFDEKFKLKFKILQKNDFLNFYSISLNLFDTGSFIWGIIFHNLKYLDKLINCLEMRANIRSVWIKVFKLKDRWANKNDLKSLRGMICVPKTRPITAPGKLLKSKSGQTWEQKSIKSIQAHKTIHFLDTLLVAKYIS